MSKSPGETGTPSEFPRVESLLVGGLLRARKLDEDPGVVLDSEESDVPSGPSVEPRHPASQPSNRKYILQGEIGRGGMGVVYKVLDTDLNRALAMKVALGPEGNAPQPVTGDEPSPLERFLEEAQVTGQLDHPGIVPLHELGIDSSGCVYFTMRLVKGRHLGECFELVRRGEDGWTEERVLIALVRTCEALAYAHAKGVVHRDLKPANLMAGRFGEVYVMDWGLAKVRGRERQSRPSSSARTVSTVRTRRNEAGGAAHETSHGTVFGTPSYMSPEQARGELDRLDARSDVYSVGAILYHFLVGTPPYHAPGASAHAVLKALLEGPPRPLRKLAPRCAPELAAICEKAMARDPRERYSGAQAMAEDLRAYLVGRPVVAFRTHWLGRMLSWGRKNRFPAGLLFAVTIGSGYGLWCLTSLGTDLVRKTALDSAAMKAQILQDVNSFYSSQVAGRVDRDHVEVTHDYIQTAGAIPIPATFLTELGERISGHIGGVRVRQYSDYPFAFRAPWVLDQFERDALARLRANPTTAVHSFEDLDGKPVLRYAVGRQMESSCVACHNAHPASPKTDWKVGDVRGVLEVIRPLDDDVARMRRGLQGTMLAIAGIVGGLLLVSFFGILRHVRGRSAGPRI